ncbi:MAG: insulinase family protein [Parachlamydiaceae bacterium]|nr:insulinase family protein [Parachlamydiaceae bacterium]
MSAHSHLQKAGDTYHQFRLIKSTPIPELQCVLNELIHEPSGAHIMHIANNDPENLFCLSFQTLPYNSNGVAHILEHTVLCGSKKYPVKDPFFAMGRRSLNTFMNALTGADFTCYPASSQVQKDFYNLLEVYLDAVFHPNLNNLSFLQEGHRLEFSVPNDPTSPLEYKGIVYNEMKGALSSVNARLVEAINQTLFPDITYGHNAGGDPQEITQLTYDELNRFHQTYYHPSRCLFYFYGNMPLEKHLDFIEEHALKKTSKVPPLPPISLQPRFKIPVYREFTYPIAANEDLHKKTFIAFVWLTCQILEQKDGLALSLLEILLLDTDASPLKKALLSSGLCKQVDSFIDNELNEIPWGIIIDGSEAEHTSTFEAIIFETLGQICSTGFSLESIESAIHQLEFYRSEIIGDQAPFGLSLFMRSGLLKQHGADPAEGLKIHSLFNDLRQTILECPNYLIDLIKKYFLENKHFACIVMKPDPHLAEKEAELEISKLEKIKSNLSEKQIEEIIHQSKVLNLFQEEQEAEENEDILPKVTLQDIPLSTKNYFLIEEQFDHLKIFHHNVFTNDIIYAELVFTLPNIPEEDLVYLRLLTIVMTQMGCNGRDYLENLDYIQGHTGGIQTGINLNLQANDHHCFHPTFHLRGKALHRKASKLFTLLKETLLETNLNDIKRLQDILIKHLNSLENRLNQNALKYAINLSASDLNVSSKMANELYGLSYYQKMREIVKNFSLHGSTILSKLQNLLNVILNVKNPHLVISCPTMTYEEIKNQHFYGLNELPNSLESIWKVDYPLVKVPSQGRIITSPVAFIGHVFQTISYTHPDSPALNIAASLLDHLFLHTEIREKGGAYGGGAVSNALSGNFYFYSYRDPNTIETLNAFKESVNIILNGDFDESDVEEAKLEIIQSLDSPVSPGSQADVAYGWYREGRTLEIRQEYRNKLLAVTKKDVISVVKSIILPQLNEGATVIFAGKPLLEKLNQRLVEAGDSPIPVLNV